MKIKELRLITNDLLAVKDFYHKQLGFLIITENPSEIGFQIGASQLFFQKKDTSEKPVYHFAFNVASEQFQAAKTWLAERTALIKDEAGADEFRFESWNADAVYFYDSVGNIVELIARHNRGGAAIALPFSSKNIENISEIAIVTTDVFAEMRRVQQRVFAPVYKSKNERFTPIGDEEGLFILVKAGRVWFPTKEVKADILPIGVTLSLAEEEEITLEF